MLTNQPLLRFYGLLVNIAIPQKRRHDVPKITWVGNEFQHIATLQTSADHPSSVTSWKVSLQAAKNPLVMTSSLRT